jgi:hypothetical protein
MYVSLLIDCLNSGCISPDLPPSLNSRNLLSGSLSAFCQNGANTSELCGYVSVDGVLMKTVQKNL